MGSSGQGSTVRYGFCDFKSLYPSILSSVWRVHKDQAVSILSSFSICHVEFGTAKYNNFGEVWSADQEACAKCK